MLTLDEFDKSSISEWKINYKKAPSEITIEEFEKSCQLHSDIHYELMEKNPGGVVCFAKNAYIINDLGYGGICSECGSDIVAIHIDNLAKSSEINYDRVCFVPGIEAYIISNTAPLLRVALTEDNLKNNEVHYKCMKCHAGWRNIEYDEDLGLVF